MTREKNLFATMAILLPVCCVMLFPIVLLISGSLTGAGEWGGNLAAMYEETAGKYIRLPLLPRFPTLVSWVELLLDTPEFLTMFWNSCKLVFPVVAGQILIGAPAAWALTRFNFKGRKLLAFVYIALMLLPFQVTMVSNFLVLDKLELINSRLAVILPGIFSPFPVFIMMRSFANIPKSLEEAALLDGAGSFRCFLSVGIPLGVPGILSAVILNFIEYWNMLEQPLTFFSDRSLWPLSLFLPPISAKTAGAAFAASVIILLPALLVFLFGQNYLEKGMAAAGVKE